MSLAFIDVETTGLHPIDHDIWEIGYAFDREPVQSITVTHRLVGAEPKALEINRYHERRFTKPIIKDNETLLRLRMEREKPTIVGANPSFDAYRLSRRWGWETPWRYRFIDVETYAMPILGHDLPHGLYDIAAEVRDAGYDIPTPDHTAYGDVETVRAVFDALVEMGRREHLFLTEHEINILEANA